jgi:PAS domain S-box-containing protein
MSDSIDDLHRRIAALQETQYDLEALLTERTAELDRVRRALEDRMAAQIRLEEDCRRASDHLNSLIDNIPGAVYRCANDMTWTMEFISEYILDISGFPAEDFVGNRKRSYASIIHPDDSFLVAASVNRGIARHMSYQMEYRIRHANGSVRWVQERGRGHFTGDGTVLWLDGVILDITDRVPAE